LEITKKIKKSLEPYMGLPREVYVIFISRMVNAMGAFVWPMMTLLLTSKIGLSEKEAGWYMMLPGIFFIFASLLGGKLADVFGRKVIIVTLELIAAGLYIMCGFIEPSMTTYYLIMAAGFCYGVADPAHGALIADITTPENRDAAYALSYMGFNLGFAIGPAIGGWLFENNLHWFFWGDAITAIIAITLLMIFVKETIHLTKEDVGVDRQLEKQEQGSIIKVLLKRPVLIGFAFIMFGYNFVYAQWSFMVPIHTDLVVEEGAKWYGFLSSFNGFVVIACTPLITLILHKLKTIQRIVVGGLLYIAGYLFFILTQNIAFFFIGVGIFTLGEIAVTVNAMPFIANHTPSSHRGRMNAIIPMISGLGFTISPMIMGNVIESTNITTAWWFVCIIMVVFSVFMVLLGHFDEKSKATNMTNEAEKVETV
jgi:MFS family permease